MTPDKTRSLLRRFRYLYGKARRGPQYGNMCFGFEHGDGWHRIIERLSYALKALRVLLGVGVQATQVKEKFGTLRYYYVITYPPGRPWLWRVVDWFVGCAESASGRTCEECGRRGVVRGRYWLACRCDDCAEAQ